MTRGLTSVLLLLLLAGPAPPALAASGSGATSARAITDRYDLAGVTAGGRSWSAAELKQLAATLAVLSPKERKAIRGVRFVRGTVPRHPRESGLFQWDRRGRRITVYSGAFAGDRSEGPNWTIVHEIGHAIAAWPLLEAKNREAKALAAYNGAIKAYNAQVNVYNSAAKRFNRTQSDSDRRAAESARGRLETAQSTAASLRAPALKAKRRTRAAQRKLRARHPRTGVLADYRAVLGRGPAPTRYARTHIRESFAEALAMYRCDPGRLQRHLPSVHAWFARGGHLQEI